MDETEKFLKNHDIEALEGFVYSMNNGMRFDKSLLDNRIHPIDKYVLTSQSSKSAAAVLLSAALVSEYPVNGSILGRSTLALIINQEPSWVRELMKMDEEIGYKLIENGQSLETHLGNCEVTSYDDPDREEKIGQYLFPRSGDAPEFLEANQNQNQRYAKLMETSGRIVRDIIRLWAEIPSNDIEVVLAGLFIVGGLNKKEGLLARARELRLTTITGASIEYALHRVSVEFAVRIGQLHYLSTTGAMNKGILETHVFNFTQYANFGVVKSLFTAIKVLEMSYQEIMGLTYLQATENSWKNIIKLIDVTTAESVKFEELEKSCKYTTCKLPKWFLPTIKIAFPKSCNDLGVKGNERLQCLLMLAVGMKENHESAVRRIRGYKPFSVFPEQVKDRIIEIAEQLYQASMRPI